MAELDHNRYTGLSQTQGKPILAEEQGGLVRRQREGEIPSETNVFGMIAPHPQDGRNEK